MLYSKTHEYVKAEGNVAFIGISEYAAKALGVVTYVDMPEPDDEIEAGEDFGAIESRKAASDLVAPVSGTVLEINEELADDPTLINKDALAAWIIKVELSDPSQLSDLMDEEAYRIFCENEKH